MQQKTRITLLIAGLLCFFGVTKSQENTGSPYTRYGLGDLMSSYFGDSKAMGGTGLALRKTDKLFVVNPASYTAIDSLHFVMEAGVSGLVRKMSSSESSNPANIYDARLDYLSLGFPVTNWWGASAGVLPYSTVGYDLVTEKENFGYLSKHYYSGSGGINKAFIGNSFMPIKNLSLGFNANYLFGNIKQQNSVRFKDEGLVNITRENTLYFSDFYFSLGAQYKYEIDKDNSLNIGLVWDMNADLSSKRSLVVTNALSTSSSNPVDTIEFYDKKEGVVSLPQTFGLGVSYQYKDILTVAADAKFQDWSDAEAFGVQDSLGAGQRFSLGAEYIPAGKNSPGLNYLEMVRYRIGGHYNNSYLQFDNGDTKINDFGISFGLGLPLKRSKTTINLSLELGQRGSTDNNLVKEQYAILGVNFSLTDIWFIKRKFE